MICVFLIEKYTKLKIKGTQKTLWNIKEPWDKEAGIRKMQLIIRMKRNIRNYLILILIAAFTPAEAQTDIAPRTASTSHEGVFRGKHLRFDAITEETFLYGKEGNKPEASVITWSYILDAQGSNNTRPVVFIFNGGPGASSSPLHLHAFGPYILSSQGSGGPVINDNSLLDAADMVFIDPVGTGYTRLFIPDSCRKYWDVREDAESVIFVIGRWLKEHKREASAVYLCGESYGTIRVAEILGIDKSFPVAGAIMLSAAFDISSWTTVPGNDLPYIFNLPTMAAIARYHRKGSLESADPSDAFRKAYKYASEKYFPALVKGNDLTTPGKHKLALELSRITGIPVDTILAKDLRIKAEDFELLLLAGEDKRTGQLDGRKTGPLHTDLRPPYNDPSMSRGDTSSVRMRKEYLNVFLGFRDSSAFKSLNLEVNSFWNWTSALKEFYFTVLPELSKGAIENPGLRIFIAGGIFDLATPLSAAKYQIDHSGISSQRIHFEPFPSGHSIFEDQDELKILSDKIRRFIVR
jgi:carboxypeptidase C (cathepsin A)